MNFIKNKKYLVFLFFFLVSTAHAADQSYSPPIVAGNQIAAVTWNSSTDEEEATAFCQDLGETYVSHATGAEANGTWTVRNYNNTTWESNGYGAPFTEVVCDDGVTGGGGGTGTTTSSNGSTTVNLTLEVPDYTSQVNFALIMLTLLMFVVGVILFKNLVIKYL